MAQKEVSSKSYTIAVCLSGIFGVVGFQHFYMGRYFEASIDLGLFILAVYFYLNGQWGYALLTFIVDSIHTFIVTIMLLTGTFKDGSGKYICYPGQKLSN